MACLLFDVLFLAKSACSSSPQWSQNERIWLPERGCCPSRMSLFQDVIGGCKSGLTYFVRHCSMQFGVDWRNRKRRFGVVINQVRGGQCVLKPDR
ncbi:hypothetical protein C8J56DRAFT_923359 [Mycena floridula]|nr:hypothetical protein C8J56DRAFT_923359 [Mycena floridula]